MNIVLINHYAGSPEMGMEFRPYYMAKEWQKKGHKVYIIAGDYSHLRKKNPRVTKDFQKENIDGITYLWLRTGLYSGNGVKRAFTMFRFVGRLLSRAKKIVQKLKPDVVISSSTYPIDTFPAQKIARLANARLIHEVHDMWPSTLIEIGGMSKYHPFVLLMQIGENSAYKHSDYVVSMAEYAKEYMVQHGLKPEKFVHINNGVVLEDWEHPAELPEEHKKVLTDLKQQGKFIVGYFGGHALSNALEGLLDIAKNINQREVHFVLVGDGVEKKSLVRKANNMKLDNITFLDPISKYAIPTLLSFFDCAYITAKNSPLYRFGLSANKIFDYMMGAKPFICAVDSASDYPAKYRCGITVKSGDAIAGIDAIQKIINMTEEERAEMGKNGKKAVLQHYEYGILANRFLDIMK